MAVFVTQNPTGINGRGIHFGSIGLVDAEPAIPTFAPTVITIPFDDGGVVTVTGSGFSIAGTGTATGMEYDKGGDILQVSDFSMPASVAANYVFAGDEDGLLADLFSENDTITGSQVDDTLNGFAGNDVLRGSRGEDFLEGGAGNDVLIGGRSGDAMNGGLGNDDYHVDSSLDIVSEAGGSGIDEVISSVDFTLLTDFERLTLSGSADRRGTGNGGDNLIIGNSGDNLLVGAAGDDTLKGGDGDDVLVGGLGRDVLIGEGGADTFRYNGPGLSPPGAGRDVIHAFELGVDTLDLSNIDANASAAGQQAFVLVGAFTGVAGQLRQAGDIVMADVNGDKVADLQIRIANGVILAETDYIL